MRNKKAQMNIQEMLFILLGVFFFFVLVGMFVLSVFYSGMYKEATDIAKSRTLSSITNLASTPEFSCGEPNCVDADKLMGLVQYEATNKNYRNYWPFSSLYVVRTSAFNKPFESMIECTAGTYPDCDKFSVYDKNVKNEESISSYVALCRKELEEGYTYNKCEIAKLVAGTEVKVPGK